MKMSRRAFLGYSTLCAGASMFPLSALAQSGASFNNKTLMVVFLRGGADGMQLVSPTGHYFSNEQIAAYRTLRPARSGSSDDNIGFYPEVDRPTMPTGAPAQPHSLDGYFELHPRLESLKDMYDNSQLAVIHAVGQAGSRSHFDAQDAVEYGNPMTVNGQTATTGWMHDAISARLAGVGWDQLEKDAKICAGLGLGKSLPKCLAGVSQSQNIISFSSIAGFGFSSSPSVAKRTAIESLYADSAVFSALRGSANVALVAEEKVGDIPSAGLQDRILTATNSGGGVNINRYKTFARQLEDVSDMVKAGVAPAYVNIDLSSWDSHDKQFTHVEDIAAGLNALGYFYQDLGASAADVCTLVMSEFGRTLDVNEDHGTDHGHGGVMFMLGGGVNGGHCYGNWPGLPVQDSNNAWISDPTYANAQTTVVSGRPMLTATTSFQQVYYEVLNGFMGYPGYSTNDPTWSTILKPQFSPGTALGLFGS